MILAMNHMIRELSRPKLIQLDVKRRNGGIPNVMVIDTIIGYFSGQKFDLKCIQRHYWN